MGLSPSRHVVYSYKRLARIHHGNLLLREQLIIQESRSLLIPNHVISPHIPGVYKLLWETGRGIATPLNSKVKSKAQTKDLHGLVYSSWICDTTIVGCAGNCSTNSSLTILSRVSLMGPIRWPSDDQGSTTKQSMRPPSRLLLPTVCTCTCLFL